MCLNRGQGGRIRTIFGVMAAQVAALAAPALGVAATLAAVTSRAALLSAALASAPATPTRGLLRCSHPLGAAKFSIRGVSQATAH